MEGAELVTDDPETAPVTIPTVRSSAAAALRVLQDVLPLHSECSALRVF